MRRLYHMIIKDSATSAKKFLDVVHSNDDIDDDSDDDGDGDSNGKEFDARKFYGNAGRPDDINHNDDEKDGEKFDVTKFHGDSKRLDDVDDNYYDH